MLKRVLNYSKIGNTIKRRMSASSNNIKNSEIALNKSIDGPAISSIREKIELNFPDNVYFKIYNDSYQHAGHAGVADSKNKVESHIRIELVSNAFNGLNLPNRHRAIYKVINDDIKKYDIHAIQLKTKTIDEYNRK